MRDPTPAGGHPWAEFLPRLRKPGRYLGGEEHQVVKPHEHATCTFVLAFPDLYEIGMSHLGTRILYELVNREPDLVCERAFTPWGDAEAELRARGLPLVSLETFTPLVRFDVVGVSLQHELCYTNVLANLELGGIPLRSSARGDVDPIVIAGGPTATHPEPLAGFIDAFLVGEAEEVLPGLLRTVGAMRRAGRSRADVLAAIARLPGVYVPSFHEVALDDRTGLQVVVGRSAAGIAADAPERVRRTFVRDLDAFPFPTRFPVARIEAIFDRAAVEITRGCTEGCRFCQAGMIYRPVRERSPAQIVEAVLDGIDSSGYDETSLTALSTADVSCISPLIKELVPQLAERKVALGVASLRAYGLDGELLDEIKRVGIDGLTFAPEAGTQRMRDVINKNVTEDDILDSARRIFSRGYERMKIYFIMGLPTETDEDVAGIAETGRRVREVARELGRSRMPEVTVSVSQHVPKPHTPFQWAAMDALDDLHAKIDTLRAMCRRYKLVIKTHDPEESWLECLFARGDRKLGDALEAAYRAGARFDGWRECSSLPRWLDALEMAGIDPTVYTRTLPVDARLPWDHLDVGLEPGFLAAEWRKAVAGRTSPPCGKPFGAQVHPKNLAEAARQTKKLVCYDCGVACDLTEMRDERVVALRELETMRGARERAEREREDAARERAERDVVPLARLAGRLARSNLAEGSAFKASAEAPASRLRLVYGKRGPMQFLGHLDLLRIVPRLFRRARIELALRRGWNPTPRMTFGPALAMGVAAQGEVVDVDVLLDCSGRDLVGELGDDERAAVAADLLARLRAVAPSGLDLVGARLLAPGEAKLGKLIEAADYVIELDPGRVGELAERVRETLARAEIVVERDRKPGHPSDRVAVDVRPQILDAHVDVASARLHLRLASGSEGGVRPREVVRALVGEGVAEHRFTRSALLARQGGVLAPLGGA